MKYILYCFRYGRDYYIKQAGKAAGASERFANKLKGEVSCDDELKSFEENYVYHSLPRRLYNQKNSTKHFVKNPLLNFPNYDTN